LLAGSVRGVAKKNFQKRRFFGLVGAPHRLTHIDTKNEKNTYISISYLLEAEVIGRKKNSIFARAFVLAPDS